MSKKLIFQILNLPSFFKPAKQCFFFRKMYFKNGNKGQFFKVTEKERPEHVLSETAGH